MKTPWSAVLCFTAGALLMLTNCVPSGPPIRQQLAKANLLGEHPVNRMESVVTFSEVKMLIYWQPTPNTLLITQLPISKVILVRDNQKTASTVEFIFDEDWLNASASFTSSDTVNPNDFVNGDTMKIARIHIAQATQSAPSPTPTQVKLIFL